MQVARIHLSPDAHSTLANDGQVPRVAITSEQGERILRDISNSSDARHMMSSKDLIDASSEVKDRYRADTTSQAGTGSLSKRRM